MGPTGSFASSQAFSGPQALTRSVVPSTWLRRSAFSVDGVELAFFEAAPSRVPASMPVVLCLHGFAADSVITWSKARVTGALVAEGYRVVMADIRGHGRSQAPLSASSYSMEAFHADALAVLNAVFGSETWGRVAVMGYSLGAVIAVSLAADERFRNRLSAVVAGGAGNNLLGEGRFSGSPDLADAMEASSLDELADVRARAYRRFAEATGANLGALAALQRGLSRGVQINLSSIQAPVLVVAGREDPVAGSPEQLASLLQRGQWAQVAGNHMNALLNEGFANVVTGFLRNVLSLVPPGAQGLLSNPR
jgi:pimeloyl-ACP methyl ester carboxylesterase